MNKTMSPVVNLKNLPSDGEDFHFTRKDGILDASLKDLIDQSDYNIEITLRPMGDIYQAEGLVKTNLNLICTRCGQDLKLALNEHFSEMIMIESKKPRKGTSSSHENSQEGPYCNFIESPNFDIGDFIHEQIASSEPYTVECGRSNCESELKKFQDTEEEPAATSKPFEALKKMLKAQKH